MGSITRVVQRPAGAGAEGHHVGGGVARAARPAAGRDPQQSRARRAAQGAARRPGLGRGRRRDPLHPDEAIRGAIATMFDRFAELGSVRQVWLWMRRERVPFPIRRFPTARSSGLSRPTTSPQRARQPRLRRRVHVREDPPGTLRRRAREHAPADASPPPAEWGVLIPDHHPGYVDKATFQANQERIGANTRPRAHQAGGAVREGSALLQGIAVCGRCGRKLHVAYDGGRGHARPVYQCPGRVRSRTAAAGACASAGCRSTTPSPTRSWRR